MGLAHTSAAEAYLSAINEEIGFDKLNMGDFPVQSFTTTYSNNDFITCSSASGTAFATGFKTNNGIVSISPDLADTLKTIAEKAKKHGMKVGIVSSVSLDHATSAVFYAHNESRNNYYEISLDLAKSDFDFFGGGGLRNPDGYNPGDDINAIELAKENGYLFVNNKEDFMQLNANSGKVLAISPGLSGGDAMKYAIDQNSEDLSLADFTAKAIELLDNDNGFFLMVEGGKIDWAAHDNDAATTVHEVIAFDAAIEEALKFYKTHPEETLILVFADHETGGMSLGADGMDGENAYALLHHQQCSIDELSYLIRQYRDEHSDNNSSFDEVLEIIKSKTGLGTEELELREIELEFLNTAFIASFKGGVTTDHMSSFLYGGNDPLAVTAVKLLGRKAGIGWTTFSHTALPVPIRAIGIGADRFGGYIDNTDIPRITEELLEIE